MAEEHPKHPYLSASVVFVAGVAGNGHRIEFAAIVTAVADPIAGLVKLALLTPAGISFSDLAGYSALPSPGTWHWPDKSAPVLVAQGVMLK